MGEMEAGFCQQQLYWACGGLDGPYGGRAERRMNISLRNGIVAGFGSWRLCLRYLKEYRVGTWRFFDRKGCLKLIPNASSGCYRGLVNNGEQYVLLMRKIASPKRKMGNREQPCRMLPFRVWGVRGMVQCLCSSYHSLCRLREEAQQILLFIPP